MVSDWARQTFPALAPAVRVPVHFSIAEYEKVWQTDDSAMKEIAAMFSAAPRFTVQRQPEAGHNISLGHTAPDYHAQGLRVRGRVRGRASADGMTRWRPVDAGRIHRVGQPGRPDGPADHRGRLSDDAVGAPTRDARAVRRHPGEGRRVTGRTRRGQRPGLPVRRRRRRHRRTHRR